ncbi:hypothetical protein Lepto7375DRAFT_0251 [Leptolyngbya sp. PCC 7375]|nr:hypothetical protein Lepto7375DRAFT_0251 [Leptolyngbya sp. PCC 7375]
MFKVIALGLKGVVILVFDLPSSAPSRDEGFNIVIRNQVVGRESVLVEDFTFGIGDDEFAPVYEQCIVAISKRDLVEIAVGIGFLDFSRPLFLDDTWQFYPF